MPILFRSFSLQSQIAIERYNQPSYLSQVNYYKILDVAKDTG
jgi:hypothetical protein